MVSGAVASSFVVCIVRCCWWLFGLAGGCRVGLGVVVLGCVGSAWRVLGRGCRAACDVGCCNRCKGWAARGRGWWLWEKGPGGGGLWGWAGGRYGTAGVEGG